MSKNTPKTSVVSHEVVRRHFVRCQCTGWALRDTGVKFPDDYSDALGRELILKSFVGTANNALFLDDTLTWERQILSLKDIRSPYEEFRQVPYPHAGLSATDCWDSIKHSTDPIIDVLRTTSIADVQEGLPIFVRNHEGILIGHDGWFRTLCYVSKGKTEISAYVLSIGSNDPISNHPMYIGQLRQVRERITNGHSESPNGAR